MVATGHVSREMISMERSDNLVGFEFAGIAVSHPCWLAAERTALQTWMSFFFFPMFLKFKGGL